ncbi:MAG: hypothetical protein RQ750_13530 [Roseovarius sp.]|nr:hypothetical protein [Roseovarius sp.]
MITTAIRITAHGGAAAAETFEGQMLNKGEAGIKQGFPKCRRFCLSSGGWLSHDHMIG